MIVFQEILQHAAKHSSTDQKGTFAVMMDITEYNLICPPVGMIGRIYAILLRGDTVERRIYSREHR